MTGKKFGEFQKKNLLILAPSYPSKDCSFFLGIFIKNQIDELKKYFKKVIIIAPVFQSLGYLKKDKVCKNYSYDNVEVYFPRSIYVPIFWFSKFLIDNRLNVVEESIKEHNLEFDLIHAHFSWPSGYIGIKLREKYRTPTILTIHEDEGWFYQEIRMNHHLINAAWTGSDALISVNQKRVPILQNFNKYVTAIPNGFDPTFYPIDTMTARKTLGLSADQKIIFTLGFLIKRKGFNYLIDAMDQICRERNDILCYIGGSGLEKTNLQEQIDQLNLSERVWLLGSVPADKLTLWINACDLFVLPSLNEGNPTVMFETLGCGKPFIGTRVGGVSEVISSEEYGLLVESADSVDLAEKILMGLDRKWDREKILAYAERFTWENIAKEILGVYEQVSV